MFLKISKFFLYAAIFSVVIVMPSTFFPFIGGKYFFFRFMTELALIFSLLWWAYEARPGEAMQLFQSVGRHPLFIAVSAFVLFYLFASIFAYDPHAAFWSNYERGEGAFQMLHYYVFFVLLAFLFRNWRDWQLAFRLSIVAAILMVLYGFLGYVSLAPWGGNLFCNMKGPSGESECFIHFLTPFQGSAPPDSLWEMLIGPARFQGSLGNPAYVAPYLIFALFYTLYLWGRRGGEQGGGRTSIRRNLWYGVLTLLFMFFFVISQTRGAFLGLGAAFFAALIFLFVTQPRLRKRVAAVFLVCIALAGTGFLFRDSAFIKRIPGSRVLELSIKADSAQTRFWTWGSAWRGFLERPILGWGPENFSAVFDRHFDPRHFVPGKNTETWFDRAHSVVFDYLAETGILGFLSYLGIFVIFYFQFAKTRFLDSAAYEKPTSFAIQDTLLFALPIAYVVQGLVLFDVLPIYLNLFLFLAFAVRRFMVRSFSLAHHHE